MLRREVVGRAALLVAFVASCSLAAAAQGSVSRDTELFAAPGSRVVATLRQGATIAVGATNGRYVEATVDGWIAAPFLGGARDSFALTVNPGNPVRLRADANAQSRVVADLRAGMGLEQVERRGAWVHVRRAGWISASAVSSQTPPDTPPPDNP
ncbi:MAG TPA: SH3 domain-containing protein, partial [Gemmatimonadaceae bacterium]|nr:SH3 domain-containing protein [Gemmatimonadaceae bacterium]